MNDTKLGPRKMKANEKGKKIPVFEDYIHKVGWSISL